MAVAAVGAIGVAAAWHARAQSASPTLAAGELATSVDRSDFRAPASPLLLAVFTSATCASCESVLREMQRHESSRVAVQDVEVTKAPDLHRRYRIDSVPSTMLVEADGTVIAHWVGPLSPNDRHDLEHRISSREPLS